MRVKMIFNNTSIKLFSYSTYLLWVSVFTVLLALGVYNIFRSESSGFNDSDKHLLNVIEAEGIQIDTNESGDSDWSFLKDELEGKKILLLGTQQTGDGSTLALKGDLIRYLHEKLEYNVVFFTESFFDVYSLNDQIRNNRVQEEDFVKALGPFIGQAEQSAKLREYVSRRDPTAHQLAFAGIDHQIHIRFKQEEILEDLKTYFRSFPNFIGGNYSSFWKSLENTAGPILYFNAPQKEMDNERDKCLREIESLRNMIVQKQNRNRLDSVYLRYIENIYSVYVFNINKDKRVNPIYYSDSLMFENFKWQAENFFNDQKVIVWAENDRLVYGDNSKRPSNLGSMIKEEYQEQVYSLLFTSYKGKIRNLRARRIEMVNQAVESTVEHGLHLKGHELTFVPMATIPKDISSINLEMRFIDYNNLTYPWMRMMDSFIYIDTMEPVYYDRN